MNMEFFVEQRVKYGGGIDEVLYMEFLEDCVIMRTYLEVGKNFVICGDFR